MNSRKTYFDLILEKSNIHFSSSLIETFGKYLTTEKKLKIAVLTVDPSSTATGG